jgi:hypothetical protein
LTAEVAEQRLDKHLGAEFFETANRRRHVARSPVQQVIAIDHGHHDVLERHSTESLGHVFGFPDIDGPSRLPCPYGAEPAPARARIAEEHDRRYALAPALADIRAVGFFADGVEVERAKRFL